MVTACGIVTVVPGRSVLVVVWVTVPVTVAVVVSVITVEVTIGRVTKVVSVGRGPLTTKVVTTVVPVVALTVVAVVVSTVVATVVPTLVRAGMAIVDGNREGRIGMVIFDALDCDVCPVDDCEWVRVGK
jgi:hypothetical protein